MARVNILEWIAKKLKSLTGIVEDGDTATHAISAGKYVIWKGNPCKASSAISIGDALNSSNLTALTDGVCNDLADETDAKVNALNSNLGNHVIRSFTKTGIAIADGSTQSPSFITIDCSDHVPTGKVIYNAIVSVQSGTQWYVLPNMENDGVRYTVLERVGNTTVVIKNTEAGWGTTNVTITLFIK